MSTLLERAALAAVLLIGLMTIAFSHEAHESYAEWYNGLRSPTGASCCSVSDCRTTEMRVRDGGYEVWIDDRFGVRPPKWTPVPPEAILNQHDNPTGRPAACFNKYLDRVLCLVRPTES